MKHSIRRKSFFERFLAAWFCFFLGFLAFLSVLLPKETFSENEKRYLSDPPATDARSILSGRFSADAETWLADHFPARSIFVGLNAQYDRLSMRQVTKSVYVGKSGRLYEAPVSPDMGIIQRNMAAINSFAEASDQSVDLMLVPSAGLILEDGLPFLSDPYPDSVILSAVQEHSCAAVHCTDLIPLFQTQPDRAALYYRTDHHWTSYGAWLAGSSYLIEKDRHYLSQSDYLVTKYSDFRGSTWTRAALWNIPSESIEIWESGTSFLVENRDRPGLHEGLFYLSHISEADKYPVFLDGNHSLVRIENRNPTAEGKLLVIRDSFANCLGCFLAEGYRETVLIDLRYYRDSVSELLQEECFDNILILYYIGNFMTDSYLLALD